MSLMFLTSFVSFHSFKIRWSATCLSVNLHWPKTTYSFHHSLAYPHQYQKQTLFIIRKSTLLRSYKHFTEITIHQKSCTLFIKKILYHSLFCLTPNDYSSKFKACWSKCTPPNTIRDFCQLSNVFHEYSSKSDAYLSK